ncbi:aldo/keto reductase [Pseudomaricurvus albidus]|uniref:aldo/keto reductase n=1 Tax=Pseudomaricurvus albidus TaxID=2842452 RepID=UPI001C0DE76B|nr:aldo/keto reductase [Aestuariicella albida]
MKEICLGTSLWGWTVDRLEAFRILDSFYSGGGRFVDTANNYPLNGRHDDFRKSPRYVSEWIKSTGVKDLKVTFKFGSLSNINQPVCDLSRDNALSQFELAQNYFAESFYCLMIHWDNRSVPCQLSDTLAGIESKLTSETRLGLSGIKYPQAYLSELENIGLNQVDIQVKHNFSTSDLKRYSILNKLNLRTWAYGISAGGIRLSEDDYDEKSYVKVVRSQDYHSSVMTEALKKKLLKWMDDIEEIENLYHLSMLFSENTPELFGYLVAPSTLSQMESIWRFRKKLSDISRLGVYNGLEQ